MICWSFPGDASTLFVIKERLKFVALLYLCCCSAGTKFIAPTTFLLQAKWDLNDSTMGQNLSFELFFFFISILINA